MTKGELIKIIEQEKCELLGIIQGKDTVIKELEQENAGLKARLNAINLLTPELKKRSKLKKQQLTEAKEIIKKFTEFVNNENEYDPEHPQEHTDLWNELCEQAEQFLKEIEK